MSLFEAFKNGFFGFGLRIKTELLAKKLSSDIITDMKLIDYIKDVKGELKHVSWPTKSQTIWFTVIVIAISLFTGFYLGFFDFIFSKLVENFII